MEDTSSTESDSEKRDSGGAKNSITPRKMRIHEEDLLEMKKLNESIPNPDNSKMLTGIMSKGQ